jgi:hypothetical protein
VRYIEDFLTGMRELGYAEGQDFEMLYRFADFHADRLPQLAIELVQLKPDIIVATATIQAVALKKATDAIPIIIGGLACRACFSRSNTRSPKKARDLAEGCIRGNGAEAPAGSGSACRGLCLATTDPSQLRS